MLLFSRKCDVLYPSSQIFSFAWRSLSFFQAFSAMSLVQYNTQVPLRYISFDVLCIYYWRCFRARRLPTHYLLLAIFYLLPTTYYTSSLVAQQLGNLVAQQLRRLIAQQLSSLVAQQQPTYNSLLIAYYLSLTTYCLLLTTSYSLLTYYLLLTTDYLVSTK